MEVRPFAGKRSFPWAILLFVTLFSLACGAELRAAHFATTNFVVTADTLPFARQVAETAEKSRLELARLWLGVELPAWSAPCPIHVTSGEQLGAGGETSFTFKGDEVFGWTMKIQGTRERILDSVVPHEVSHMILASYFRRPVPRWIDEGAATSIEADAERSNYRRMLIKFLNTSKGIPFNQMVRCTEYPADMMPFYAQGFSACEFLIAVGGHRRLIEFTRDAITSGDWAGAMTRNYGFDGMNEFQIRWTEWVSDWYHSGMPEELPQVAKIADYPYDIAGRPISRGASAPDPILLASLNAQNENRTVSFDSGVGTAAPSVTLAYQGSYGRSASAETAPAPTPTGAPTTGRLIVAGTRPSNTGGAIAPPVPSFGPNSIVLGQEKP